MSEYIKYKINSNGFTSPFYNYLIGGTAGICGSIIGTPMQVVKVSMQANDSQKINNSIQYVKYNYHANGLSGFYRGFMATAIKDFMFGASFVGSYYTLRDYVGTDVWWKSFLSGATAQCFTWATLIPMDFIKTNIQKSETNVGMKYVIMSNYKKHGIRVFWRGVVPACTRTIPISEVE
jgi:hypothetical protein